MPRSCPESAISSLVWATDIDVLQAARRVERRDGYWVICSPTNPEFWWGNFLLFDDPPGSGDGDRWERCFEVELGGAERVRHRALAWDRTDGYVGAAEDELVGRGYKLEWTAGLTATPDRLRRHPRANDEVQVKLLSPESGSDEDLWRGVTRVQVAERPEGTSEQEILDFRVRRQRDLRELFCSGDRGGWFVAIADGQVVASLGIVVTQTRARFQTVDTLASHRRRGIATRLVHEAAEIAARSWPVSQFVIAADPDYHAIQIYEELGFRRAELVCGALLTRRSEVW